MTRLIDADVLMQKIETYLPTFSINPNKIVELVEDAPTVERPERPYGEWIVRFGNTFITCNKCGYMKGTAGPYFRTHFEPLPNFCEFCGADMRGGEKK